MPAAKRLRARVARYQRAAVALTVDEIDALTLGAGPLRLSHRLRALWDQHRDLLVRRWIEERPGTRPSAWWVHDAPEPRQQVAGPAAHPPFRNLRMPIVLGIPMLDYTPTVRFESQAAYLIRLSLLADGEHERLAAGALEPELLPDD